MSQKKKTLLLLAGLLLLFTGLLSLNWLLDQSPIFSPDYAVWEPVPDYPRPEPINRVVEEPVPEPAGPVCRVLWDTSAYLEPAYGGEAVTLAADSQCYLLESFVNGYFDRVMYQQQEYYVPCAAMDLSGCDAAYVFTPDQDMRTRTCFSGEQLELCLSGGLAGLGESFAAAEAAYGVNALFMIAICQHESGNGASGLATGQNNLIGLRSGAGWASFSSYAECVDYLGDYLTTYYLPPDGSFYHGSTISGVSVTYCGGSSAWINHIGNYMQKDLDKILAGI